MAKKEKSTFTTSLGHLLTVACIVLVFVFGSLPYIVYTEDVSALLPDNSGQSFYDVLKSDDVWFKGGLAIVIVLGIVGLLTVVALLAGLSKKKKSKISCFVLGGLLVVVAVLIFFGYEMYFAQVEEDAGILGSFASSLFKEITQPGAGYYLMGIAASAGAGVEILTGLL